MSRIQRANHSTSPGKILSRESFDCNTMSGRAYDEGQAPRLVSPSKWAGHMLDQTEWHQYSVDTPVIDYVVYSYATPIAWRRSDGSWHVVSQKFSPTTSKHQSRLYLIPSRPDNTGGLRR